MKCHMCSNGTLVSIRVKKTSYLECNSCGEFFAKDFVYTDHGFSQRVFEIPDLYDPYAKAKMLLKMYRDRT